MIEKVYIVITNYTNGWSHLIECLESLLKIEHKNYQIIIVDDYSQDNGEDRLKDWAVERNIGCLEFFDTGFPPDSKKDDTSLILIRSTFNRGFAGANNLAFFYILSREDFKYVWLLNNDTVVKSDALDQLIIRIRERPDAGMCGSTLLYYKDRRTIQTLGGASFNKWTGIGKQINSNQTFRPDMDQLQVEKKLDYIYGASMLVTKNFLKDVGLMNEEYFIYFEEIDWAVRAKGRYKLTWAPGSLVYHKAGVTIGGGYNTGSVSSLFSDYYYFKNMLHFTRKFYPWAIPSVYLRQLVMLFQKIKGRQWPNARLLLKVMLGIEIRPENLPRIKLNKENHHV